MSDLLEAVTKAIFYASDGYDQLYDAEGPAYAKAALRAIHEAGFRIIDVTAPESLQRYGLDGYPGEGDYMVKDDQGDYVLIEDVWKLFRTATPPA